MTKMNNLTMLLCALLALCVLFVCMAGAAMAEDGSYCAAVTTADGAATNYTDLGVAIAEAQANEGSTLTLLDDMSVYNSYDVTGGYCGAEGDGTNLVWTLNDDTLTISGTGAMADYPNCDDSPWYDSRTDITALSIQEGVTNIGRFAFCDITGLKSVTIPASVTKLGDGAFMGSGLEAVTFAEGSQLTTIDNYAFQNCTALTEITLPASVTSLTYTVFSGCAALTDIHVAEGNTAYKDIDGVLYTADGTTLVVYPQDKTAESFTTPAGVTTIGELAFYVNRNTKSITLSEGVTILAPAFGTVEDWAQINGVDFTAR